MAKIRRDQVVESALELLNELGLDALSTRRLAQKLGVESATLYWHFRDKSVLLAEMAAAVLARHHRLGVPADTAHWSAWFAENARSFRRALLAYRDGARLHAGTTPGLNDINVIKPKIAYLMRAGFTEQEAGMALFATSQFTIGCVLEEQTQREEGAGSNAAPPSGETDISQRKNSDTTIGPIDPEVAFEFGLGLIVDGLHHRVASCVRG